MQQNKNIFHARFRRTIQRSFRILTFLVWVLIMSACIATTHYTHPQGELRGCGPTLRLDIVATETARQQGLMGVPELPTNYGMLFVFQDTIQPAFWMKDTLIPLEVVFMSKQGQIKAITAMHPQSEEIHSAPEPLPYALELPQGWMTKHGIVVGDTCTIELPQGLVVE
ncbi:MAG: DUF192 domain-containing protein [Chloroflexota bacterium]|jgi:uncharacterized membrane protein (UPF0127 family)